MPLPQNPNLMSDVLTKQTQAATMAEDTSSMYPHLVQISMEKLRRFKFL